MFKKISIFASLLFFLLGTNVIAQTHLDITPSKAASKQAVHSTMSGNIEPSQTIYILPGSIGILLIIGFGSYWLIYRRKTIKKKRESTF
jgi:hypothetical protein